MQMARTALWVVMLLCTLGLIDEAHAARWKDKPQPVYLSFKADSDSIQAGQAVTLSWAASNTNQCRATGGWGGKKPASGTHQISNLTAPTEFGLKCGSKGSFAEQTVFVDVVQTEPPPPPPPPQPTRANINRTTGRSTFIISLRKNKLYWADPCP